MNISCRLFLPFIITTTYERGTNRKAHRPAAVPYTGHHRMQPQGSVICPGGGLGTGYARV